MMRSLHDNLTTEVTLPIQAHTANSSADTAADVAGAMAVQFLLTVGTWTDGTHTVRFFHRDASDDSWSRVKTIDLDGALGTELTDESGDGAVVISSDARDDSVASVGYIGGKRYVKAETVASGTTTGAVYGVQVQSGMSRSVGLTPMSPTWLDGGGGS